MSKFNLRLGVTLIAIALLQACATTPQPKITNKQAKGVLETIKPDEKLNPIVLSISFNSGIIYPSLKIESLTEKTAIQKNNKIYEIKIINSDVARSTFIYSGQLPAGEYRIVELSNYQPSPNPFLSGKIQFINLNDKDKPHPMGTFKVLENTTTDLGRINLTHANDAYLIARSEKHSSNKDLINKLKNNYLEAIYKDKILNGWTQPVSTLEKKIGDESKILPFGMQCFKELKDNTIIASSKIGSVFFLPLQDTNKKTKVFQSNDNLAFDCVTIKENYNFDFLAYGEMNTLYKHLKGSDVLTPIDSGNLPIGIISSIVGDDQNEWFLSHITGRKATVYKSNRLENGDWQPIVQKDILDNFWGLSGFWMWEDEQGFSYADMYGKINHYDYTTKKWSENKVPNNENISQLVVNPDKSISVITSKRGFAGIFSNLFNSNDHGVTWQKVNSPFKVNVFPAQVSKQGDLYISGAQFNWDKLAISEDAGKTWQMHEIMAPSSIVTLNSGALLNILYSGQYALVKISNDKGKTWETLYSTHNRNLRDLSK
ncbi:WD40/YVTN/BNR-like repeat-containing protein [Acinetobacter pittii]